MRRPQSRDDIQQRNRLLARRKCESRIAWEMIVRPSCRAHRWPINPIGFIRCSVSERIA